MWASSYRPNPPDALHWKTEIELSGKIEKPLDFSAKSSIAVRDGGGWFVDRQCPPNEKAGL